MFSVAFEGCACRAAFHIGVAQGLHRAGLRPSVIAGASSGSLVAAAWAADELIALEERWLDLVGRAKPFDLRVLRRGRWPGRMSHILREGLEQDHGALRLADLPRLRVAVTRLGLRGRRLQILGPEHDLGVVHAVLGSCFIPGPYSRPVIVKRRLVVDGAWLERVPIDALPTRGLRIAVVGDSHGRLRTGLFRPSERSVPAGLEVVHPRSELRARGFVFDRIAAEEGIAEGRSVAVELIKRNAALW